MSEEERSESEYEEEEEPEKPPTPEPEKKPVETPKLKKAPTQFAPPPGKELSEGELALMAAKKKQSEEEEARYQEYLEIRKEEREKENKALHDLRERQVTRKKEREEEEEALAEARRVNEEMFEAEEEEMRGRKEDDKARRAAERTRRQQELSNILGKTGPTGDTQSQSMTEAAGLGGGPTRIKPPKHWVEMEHKKTQDELDNERRVTLERRAPKKTDVSGSGVDDLKKKATDLQARIVRLETEKYEMEKRIDRQLYDLKELGERQKQQQKQKALKLGVDPESMMGQKHPSKKAVSSKYDRQIDSRSFDDRKKIFKKGEEIEQSGEGAKPAAEERQAEAAVAQEEEEEE